MTTSTQILPTAPNVDNLKDIEARAARVSSLLRTSATVWLEIAKEVYDAKQSLSADDFNIFLRQASLTTAVADKMPRIAKTADLYSDEAKKHIQKFEGWSTLYEASKLNSDERKELIDHLNKNPDLEVSRAFIQSFRKATKSVQKSETIIVEIKFNDADISRINYDQFLNLKEEIDNIRRKIDRLSPAVSITVKDDKISKIEDTIINQSQDFSADFEEFSDELLPITTPAANSDCSISHVAF
jgi:hypothetical protein